MNIETLRMKLNHCRDWPEVAAVLCEALEAEHPPADEPGLRALEQQAYELCLEIEKLPCGEQQTKCSVLASKLRADIASGTPALVSPDEPGLRAVMQRWANEHGTGKPGIENDCACIINGLLHSVPPARVLRELWAYAGSPVATLPKQH